MMLPDDPQTQSETHVRRMHGALLRDDSDDRREPWHQPHRQTNEAADQHKPAPVGTHRGYVAKPGRSNV